MESRLRAWRRGRRAEALAALLLRFKGYRVLVRDYRCAVGEIDIIVRRGGLIAFVEVKWRRRLADAVESIGPRQQRRIVRAAGHYLAGNPSCANHSLRFDAVVMAPGRLPRHLTDAFQADGMF